MNTESEELFQRRRAAFKSHVAAHNGVLGRDVEEVCHLGRSRGNVLLNRMLALGDIYRSGYGHGMRYWINEAHYLEKGKEDQERRTKRTTQQRYAIKRQASDTMTFLCYSRPAGINTVFAECRKNAETLISVLQVMARRHYG